MQNNLIIKSLKNLKEDKIQLTIQDGEFESLELNNELIVSLDWTYELYKVLSKANELGIFNSLDTTPEQPKNIILV